MARIMIVEDESIIARDIQRSLEGFGYQVTAIASSGVEALEKAEKDHPDLILMDIVLKGAIDGIETARRIKTGFGIPIIYLTANSGEDFFKRAKTTEPFGYLFKPFEERELHYAIGMALYKSSVEKKLKESEERLSAITSNTNDAIILLDPHGRITFWNPAAERIFGFLAEEIIGKDMCAYILPEEYRSQHLAAFNAFLTSGNGRMIGKTVEYSGLRKNGGKFPLALSVAALRIGDEWHAVGTVRDITEKKRSEEKLVKAKEDAEEATRLKDHFVSLVAHDLRTPLTVIIGVFKLLHDETIWERKEEVRKILANTLESAEHMAYLIEDVLNISKLRAGKIRLTPFFLDAHFIADRAITALAPIAEKKKIRIGNNIGLKTRIYADPTLFYEVIQNLLTNAIKFSNEGGTVSLFTPKERRGAISVADNGVGIAPERIPGLFNFETKSSTPGTAGEKGTGFGLPLSNDIMLAHGGSLEVESEKGKGSVFHAVLPVVCPAVLLVDGEAASRGLFIHYLKSMNVEVIEAESGRQALEIINGRPVHLVISDIKMQGMDGYQLLEKIRGNPKTGTLPFIALTSASAVEVREKAFKLGANDFVSKVVAEEDFIARVGRFVG